MFAVFLRFVAGLRCCITVWLISFMEVFAYAKKCRKEAEGKG